MTNSVAVIVRIAKDATTYRLIRHGLMVINLRIHGHQPKIQRTPYFT
jgi:hypothetical protein